MCNSDALSQLLKIASMLAGLTVSRLKAMQERLSNSIITAESSDSDGMDMDAEISSEDNREVEQKIVGIFLAILNLLRFLSEHPESKKILLDKVTESIDLLNGTVIGYPGYKRQDMDETVDTNLREVMNLYREDGDLYNLLTLCKRVIFE